ncbi:MAG: hypothetical protein ACYTEL_08235 [Planctomycetota bacterium]|jgi:hypothetical protein
MKKWQYYTAMLGLLAGLLGGCATPRDKYPPTPIAEGRFGSAAEKLKEQAAGLARQKYHSVEEQEKFIHSYYEGYESGLRCIYGRYASGNEREPHDQGFQAGRAAAIADIKGGSMKVTLKDFGYVYIERKGKLQLAFENSEFVPEDSDARWWVACNRDIGKRYSKLRGKGAVPPRSFYVYAHFRGYLSPDRGIGVGHMGVYDRYFVVTEIVDMRKIEERPNQDILRTR